MRIWRAVVALLLIVILFCACDTAAPCAQDACDKVPYGDAYYISQEEREAWREPLTELLSRVRYFDSALRDEDVVEIMPYRPVSLLDVDLDGVPEVIVDLGGGTLQNALYVVYDLLSGENKGSFDGSYLDPTCFYYDTAENDYALISRCSWRSGFDGRHRFVTVREGEGSTSRIALSEHYYLEHLGDDGFTVTYQIDDEWVSIDTYYDAYTAFWTRYVRLPETEVVRVFWSELDGYDREADPSIYAELMADRLLGSEQQFIDFD